MPDPSDTANRELDLHQIHRKRRFPRYRSLLWRWMWGMLRRPDRAKIAPLPTVEPGQVSVTFAGHATVLIRYAELTVACDPMLGKWIKGVKRAVAPGLSPADFHDVDLVLISHAHADHLHLPTLAKLPRTATLVVPPRTARFVSNLGFARVVELGVGESVQHRGVDIWTAAVRHGHPDEVGALSYVLRGDGPSVYFCGDSGYFSGFEAIGTLHAPDVAILPIGGYYPRSFRDRHMSPLDALYAFEDLRAKVMVPIHYGAFPLSYERLHDPGRWLSRLIEDRGLESFVIELEPGQSRVFVPPRTALERPPRAETLSEDVDMDADDDEDHDEDQNEDQDQDQDQNRDQDRDASSEGSSADADATAEGSIADAEPADEPELSASGDDDHRAAAI